jgi:hypothetical protein
MRYLGNRNGVFEWVPRARNNSLVEGWKHRMSMDPGTGSELTH